MSSTDSSIDHRQIRFHLGSFTSAQVPRGLYSSVVGATSRVSCRPGPSVDDARLVSHHEGMMPPGQ